MYKLYLDTANKYLIIILLKNNEVIESLKINSFQKQTETAVSSVNEILSKNNLNLSDINEIAVTIGPGSYTGIRVGITFVKTLKVLNPNLRIFTINNLLLQAGNDTVISIISGYNFKYYLAVYNHGKQVIVSQLVSETAKLGIIDDLQNYKVLQDYNDTDIIKNFVILEKYFEQIYDINDLQALYITNDFKQLS